MNTNMERIKAQRQRWMDTEQGRIYHAYNILIVKFGRLKDTGDIVKIKKALCRIRHLERHIKAIEA